MLQQLQWISVQDHFVILFTLYRSALEDETNYIENYYN